MRRRGKGDGGRATVLLALVLAVAALGSAALFATGRVPSRATLPQRQAASVALPAPAAPRALQHVSRPEPGFRARILPIDAGIRKRMGTSWRSGCPVELADLRVLELTFWSFQGEMRTGELMVHRRYAGDITGVFRKLFDARFPIERMVLANGYMGNDPPLAQFNNTAGFNCRRSVGSRAWSEHAFGRAVDINPDQNPYVSPSGRVEPPFGRRWVDRSLRDPGMIRPGDAVVEAFRAIGWRWGGSYRTSKDWMHFSPTGR